MIQQNKYFQQIHLNKFMKEIVRMFMQKYYLKEVIFLQDIIENIKQ